MNRFPSVFLSHGSPMHALDSGAAGVAWKALANALPRPKAILVITAHWESNLPLLSGSGKPSMIYDFGGFPETLYQIQYPAPGAPDLAMRAHALLKSADIVAGVDGIRGMDHGTWVPLLNMYPSADIPVVQLSVQPSLGPGHHIAVGRALAPLRDEGVLILGSGHLTHNLRDWMQSRGSSGRAAYAVEFQSWTHEKLTSHDVDALVHYREINSNGARAHPTEEHFLPLFVAVGAAMGGVVTRLYDGFEGSALAMDAYRLD